MRIKRTMIAMMSWKSLILSDTKYAPKKSNKRHDESKYGWNPSKSG